MAYIFVFICVLIVSAAFAKPYIVAPSSLKPSNYQLWAHYPWVWLHNGQSNQDNVTDLVEGYAKHRIPVGGVNIDSMWATEFNNFVVNTEKFPNFSQLIKDLHSKGLHVILWYRYENLNICAIILN
jgi:hypothetical protein